VETAKEIQTILRAAAIAAPDSARGIIPVQMGSEGFPMALEDSATKANRQPNAAIAGE